MIEGGGPDRGIGALQAPVVVLSGPSAVGKSSVVRCLRERVADLYFSVSVTTRAPRPGEVDGVDYTFVTPERFQRLIDEVRCWSGPRSMGVCTGREHPPSRCALRRRPVDPC